MKLNIISAAFFLVLLASCDTVFFEEEPVNNPEAVFEQLWKTFDEYYGGFDQRNLDWDAVYDQYRPLVNASTSEDQLYDVCTSMLATTNDGHVEFTAPGRVTFNGDIYTRELIDYDLFDTDVIKSSYLATGYEEDSFGGYLYGRIGDVVYLALPFISDNMAIMDKVLDENADAVGLIVDLRHSNGGDFTWAFPYMTRFFQQEEIIYRSRSRTGPERDDFSEWTNWSIAPDGKYWDKPIVMLTDRYAISATERLALGFRALPNVTIIGDPTNGSLATKIGKELQNGWYVGLPVQEIFSADGQVYEGAPIMPDIQIENTRENLDQGIDDVLEAALNQF